MLHQDLLADKTMTVASSVTRQATASGVAPRNGPLLFAAWHVADSDGLAGDLPLVGGCFNGKIERPRLANRALDRGALLALMGGTIPAEPERNRSSRAGISRATSRPRSSATPLPIAWTASPSICRRAP